MNIKIISIVIISNLFLLKTYAQSTLILHPSEDTQVGFHDGTGAANQNAGTANYYGAFWQPSTTSGENGSRGLMKFDLSAFTSGVDIVIDLSDLDSGIYFLKIIGTDLKVSYEVKKIIKQ